MSLLYLLLSLLLLRSVSGHEHLNTWQVPQLLNHRRLLFAGKPFFGVGTCCSFCKARLQSGKVNSLWSASIEAFLLLHGRWILALPWLVSRWQMLCFMLHPAHVFLWPTRRGTYKGLSLTHQHKYRVSLNINKGITFLNSRGCSQEDNWSFAVVLVCAIICSDDFFDKYSSFFNPSLASKGLILHSQK